MAITPTGSTPWTRNADHTTYGGNVDKTNYQSQGVVNARTDVGAEDFCRMANDLAACVRVMPFAVILYTSDDTGTNDPTVSFCQLQTGGISSPYAGGSPPTGFPSVTRVSDGHVEIAFDASYSDEYSVSGSFTPVAVDPAPQGANAFDATYTISGTTVTVYATSGGSPATDKTVKVSVW